MAKAKKQEKPIEQRLEEALVLYEKTPYELPSNWCWVELPLMYQNVTSSDKKIPQKSYLEEGQYSIVDQGKDLVGGYTNDNKYLYEGTLPVVIFGDHTRAVKYIDFEFAQGADGVKVLKPAQGIYPKYLYYCIKNLNITDLGYRRHFPLFPQYCAPLAPLEEQKRIVEIIEKQFAKLDEARDLIQKSLDSFADRKSAILHKAFTGDLYRTDTSDDCEGALLNVFSYREDLVKRKVIQRAKIKPMEDKDKIQYFPKHWKQLKLGDISFVTKLAGFEYTKYIRLQETGEIPVVRAQNVRKGYLDTSNVLYIDSKTSENLSRSALDKTSILITFIGAGIGDVCVFNEKQRYHLAPNVAKVEPYCDDDGEINIKFLLYYLLSSLGQKKILKSMKAVAQPSLSMEAIRDIVVPFTSRKEQDEIVRILDSIFEKEDKSKELIDMLDKIDEMKKSILARAFRGQLGTSNPTDEPATDLLRKILEYNNV